MTANKQKLAAHEAGNQECARIVLADPERYPGLMQEWARLVLSKAGVVKTAEKELPLWGQHDPHILPGEVEAYGEAVPKPLGQGGTCKFHAVQEQRSN